MPSHLLTAIKNLTNELTRDEIYSTLSTEVKLDQPFSFKAMNRKEGLLNIAIKTGISPAVDFLFDATIVHPNDQPEIELTDSTTGMTALACSVSFEDLVNEPLEEKKHSHSGIDGRRAILKTIAQKSLEYQELQIERCKQLQNWEKQQAETKIEEPQGLSKFFHKKSNKPVKIAPTPLQPLVNRHAYLLAIFYNNQKFLKLDHYHPSYVIDAISEAFEDKEADVQLSKEKEAIFLKDAAMPKYSNTFIKELLKEIYNKNTTPSAIHLDRSFPDLFHILQIYRLYKEEKYFSSPDNLKGQIRFVVEGNEKMNVLTYTSQHLNKSQSTSSHQYWVGKIIELDKLVEGIPKEVLLDLLKVMPEISYFVGLYNIIAGAYQTSYHPYIRSSFYHTQCENFVNQLSSLNEENIHKLFVVPVKRIFRSNTGTMSASDETINLLTSLNTRSLIIDTVNKLINYLVETEMTLAAFKIFFSLPLHMELYGKSAAESLLKKMQSNHLSTYTRREFNDKWNYLIAQKLELTLDYAKTLVTLADIPSVSKEAAYDLVIKTDAIGSLSVFYACIAHEKAAGRLITPLLTKDTLSHYVAAGLFDKNCNFIREFGELPLELQQTHIKNAIIQNSRYYGSSSKPQVIYDMLDKLPQDIAENENVKTGLIKIGSCLLDCLQDELKLEFEKIHVVEEKPGQQQIFFQAFLEKLDKKSQKEIVISGFKLSKLNFVRLQQLLSLIQKYNLITAEDVSSKDLITFATAALEHNRMDLNAIYDFINLVDIKKMLAEVLEKRLTTLADFTVVTQMMQYKQITHYGELFAGQPQEKIDSFIDKGFAKIKDGRIPAEWLNVMLHVINQFSIKLKCYPTAILQNIFSQICPSGNIIQFKLFIKNSPSEISNLKLETVMNKGYDIEGNRRIECLIAAIKAVETSYDDNLRLNLLNEVEVQDRAALRDYFVGTRHSNFIRNKFNDPSECQLLIVQNNQATQSAPILLENKDESPLENASPQKQLLSPRSLSLFKSPQQTISPLKQFLQTLETGFTALPEAIKNDPASLKSIQQQIETFKMKSSSVMNNAS